MARAKKEAALTPEERLQAALVPDWEWPYKLPENWCWTRIGNYVDYVTDYVANGSFASLKANVSIFKDENYALMVKTQDFANGFTKSLTYTDKHGYDFLSKSTLHGGELILSNIGSVGKVFRVPYFDRPMTLASNSVMVKCYNSRDYDWMYYFLLSPIGFEELKSITTGTAVPKFNKTDLKTIPLPVPPLAEQQRIVDRIESLFAKLDEAKEKAQAVVDSFETRKAAILHKAFTGELTAKWREEHGVGMESWEQCSISDVCTVNPKKADTKDLPDELEVSFFPMPALSEIYGEITDPQTRLLKEVRSGFTNFSEGDVVFAKITPCMENGKSAVVGKLVNDIGYGTTEFFVLRCSDRLYNRFLYHLVRDKLFRDKAKAVMAGAVGQQRVPKRYLETYKLNLPKFNEQREIVRILDGSFAKEQQAKEAAEAVLDQIDLMKKSILARAFRGELGTNDPNEESAVELLKRGLEKK